MTPVRQGLLILSGYNVRAVVALCRRATEAGLPFHIVARDVNDPIYLTDYAPLVCELRATPRLDAGVIATWIRRLRTRHGYSAVWLAPSTEFLNRVMLDNRPALEAAGGIVPLVDRELYARISDKHAFAELCAARGVPVPAAFAHVPDQYPFVAKPRCYGAATSGQIKPYLIHTPAERQRFLAREDAANFFFQEFVSGPSLYLLAHRARDGALTTTAQENLIQQPHGGSVVLARAHDFHRRAEAAPYLQLLTDVRFQGPIMIEVRHCVRTGRYVMIEANPRLWGPLQFTLDQRVDIVGAYLGDHGFDLKPMRAKRPRHAYYYWSGGLNRGDVADTFHHYSVAQFQAEQPAIAAADLFNRPDTQRLLVHEQAEAQAA